jgi:hypothetical protein
MLTTLFDLLETPDSLVIRKRPLPPALTFLFGLAWFAFGAPGSSS